MKSNLLCLILCVAFFQALSQNTPAKTLEQIKASAQPEKVFIHFDKDYYLPGETVWFKTYLLSGIELSMNSSAIKIELINDSGRVITEKLLPVFGATAAGNIDLPVNLAPGNYLFRAYTRWMMNFGNSNFYEKNLQVYLPGKQISPSDFSIVFKAEGTNLVEDLSNTVGFRAVDEWKRPVEVEGVVVNNKGDTVSAFAAVSNGLGKFDLFVKPGETYTAYCKALGKEKTISLPAATKSVKLSVTENSKGKEFIITDEYDQSPASIIGAIENNIVFEASLPAGKSTMRGTIPTANLPTGILTIGIFDAKNKLLATRATFVHNTNHLINATLKADTVSTIYRGKNVYTLSAIDSIEGNFSVAVVESDRITPGGDNILSRLLLSDDSKLPLVNPRSYLDLPEAQQKEMVDLLMLTYESKYNNWKDLFNKPQPKIQFKDNNFISLEGIVTTDNNKSKLLKETQLNLFVRTKDSSTNFYIAETDTEGKLIVDGLIFEDTATIYFQNNTKKHREKAVDIELTSKPITNLFMAPVDLASWKGSTVPIQFSETEKRDYATKAKDNHQTEGLTLDEVKVTAAKKTPTQSVEDRYTSGVFSGQSRKTLDFINEPPLFQGGNIFQYLTGRFSYLNVVGSFPNYSVQYRGTMSLAGGAVYMTLFLDEMQTDAATIATIPMKDFAMVKIMSTGFVGSAGGGLGGALAFYTKKHEDGGGANNYSNLNSIKVPGFSSVKNFTAPEYGNISDPFNRKDNRTTLYWNPNVTLNEDNPKAKIVFYNPDTVKKYKIIVQGISSDGRLLYIERPLQ